MKKTFIFFNLLMALFFLFYVKNTFASNFAYLLKKSEIYNNEALKDTISNNRNKIPLAVINNIALMNISYTKRFKTFYYISRTENRFFKEAVNYALLALKSSDTNKEKSSAYNMLSSIYFNLGYEKSCYKYSILEYKSYTFGRIQLRIFGLGELGEFYYRIGNYNKAVKYLKIAIIKTKKFVHLSKHFSIAEYYQFIGLSYKRIGNYNKALYYLNKSYKYYKMSGSSFYANYINQLENDLK